MYLGPEIYHVISQNSAYMSSNCIRDLYNIHVIVIIVTFFVMLNCLLSNNWPFGILDTFCLSTMIITADKYAADNKIS